MSEHVTVELGAAIYSALLHRTAQIVDHGCGQGNGWDCCGTELDVTARNNDSMIVTKLINSNRHNQAPCSRR